MSNTKKCKYGGNNESTRNINLIYKILNNNNIMLDKLEHLIISYSTTANLDMNEAIILKNEILRENRDAIDILKNTTQNTNPRPKATPPHPNTNPRPNATPHPNTNSNTNPNTNSTPIPNTNSNTNLNRNSAAFKKTKKRNNKKPILNDEENLILKINEYIEQSNFRMIFKTIDALYAEYDYLRELMLINKLKINKNTFKKMDTKEIKAKENELISNANKERFNIPILGVKNKIIAKEKELILKIDEYKKQSNFTMEIETVFELNSLYDELIKHNNKYTNSNYVISIKNLSDKKETIKMILKEINDRIIENYDTTYNNISKLNDRRAANNVLRKIEDKLKELELK